LSFKTVTGVVQLLFLKVIVITITIKITVKKLTAVTITNSISINSTENLF
jgi:hypothetical protein